MDTLIDSIDALLPQTQCTRCGFPTCRDYATAIATQREPINQCPPGGAEGIELLAKLLGRTRAPLNPANGIERPAEIAVIDEDICIGCTKCIQACPVDAIIGTSKAMHSVLSDECSGCELCLAPCPVDCIDMVPAESKQLDPRRLAPAYRARFEARNARLALEEQLRVEAAAQRGIGKAISSADVLAAVARAKAKKASVISGAGNT